MATSKYKVLTLAVLAAGLASVQKVISEKPEEAAADILLIAEEAAAAATAKSELASALEVNKQLVEELESQPEISEAVKNDFHNQSFTLGDKKYGFHLPEMKLKGAVITHLDVVKDKDLQAELIKRQSGMIYEKA